MAGWTHAEGVSKSVGRRGLSNGIAVSSTHPFSRTHRQTTDKCHAGTPRKVTRFSARGSAPQIAIGLAGILPHRVTAVETPQKRRQKSNVLRVLSFATMASADCNVDGTAATYGLAICPTESVVTIRHCGSDAFSSLTRAAVTFVSLRSSSVRCASSIRYLAPTSEILLLASESRLRFLNPASSAEKAPWRRAAEP